MRECGTCAALRFEGDFKPRYTECRYCVSDKHKQLRIDALRILGDCVCSRCGFGDIRALQFDHVNGGGIAARKHIGYIQQLRKILNDEAYRKQFQVLCANCNWIKRIENGEHKKFRELKVFE